MIFSDSPVKNIVEKLNPFSQKNKISRLKFERKSDYKTFLKFIKDSTKEIKDIEISDFEDKKRKGLLIGGGLLGLGLLASLGRGKGDSDDDDTGKLKSIAGVIEKAKSDSRKAVSGGKDRRRLDQGDDVLDKARFERSKRLRKIRKQFQTKGSIEQRKINVEEYLKKREKRKTRKVRKKYIKKPGFSVNPTKRREFAGITGDTLSEAVQVDDNQDQKIKKRSRRRERVAVTSAGGVDGDTKIGFPSEKDIEGEKKLTKKKFKSDVQKITTSSSDDKKIEKSIVRNFNKRQKNFNQNQQVFMDVDGTFKTNYDDLSPEAKKMDSNTKKLNKILNQPGASRVNPYTRFDSTEPFMDDDLGQRTGKTTDKLELKPPKKLTQFDKFNRFSNRILNSPAAKFTTFMGGLLANPKFMILKSLMEPTPLADGTLEGKPGVGVFSEQLMFDEDMAVNIFMPSEKRESMIPFDADIKTPLVTTPTDLPTPSSNIFIDPKQQLNIDDIFFLRSFSGG